MILEVILASMPESVTEAFCKALYVFMLSAVKEKGASSTSISNLKKWGPAASPLVTRFKLKSFNKVYKDVVKNGKVEDDEALKEFGFEIKKSLSEIHAEHDIKKLHLDIIKNCGKWFRNQSEPSYKKLEKIVSSLNESALNAEFIKEIGSQAPYEKALRKIVKVLTGKNDTVISIADVEKAKQKKEVYKEYLRLRKGFNDVWKSAIASHVRKSGKSKLPYQDVLKYLKQQGIKHNLHQNFDGFIDDQGQWYTTAGKLIQGTPSPLMPTLIMNPEYNAKEDNSYVFKVSKLPPGQAEKDKFPVWYYTVDYKKGATKEKFETVEELEKKIPTFRKTWLAYLKGGSSNPRSVPSTILEILYQFSARIGSGPKSHKGISSLLVKNVKVKPNGIVLKYLGKGDVPQQHILMKNDPIQKFMIANILDYMKGKKPNDLLFTIKNKSGKQIHVSGVMVNKFFRKLGAGNATVHKIRTLTGTRIFKDELQKLNLTKYKGKVSEADAKKLLIKLAEKVGEQLGHMKTFKGQAKVTGMTAIQNYIEPTAMLEMFKQLNVRPPHFLDKFQS